MPHSSQRRRTHQIETLRAQFAQADGLPCADVLPSQRLERALQEEGATGREARYTPALTVGAFLTQGRSPDGSCRAAVARGRAWLIGQGQPPCPPKTDPSCKARQRLPESLRVRLLRETGRSLHAQAPQAWRRRWALTRGRKPARTPCCGSWSRRCNRATWCWRTASGPRSRPLCFATSRPTSRQPGSTPAAAPSKSR